MPRAASTLRGHTPASVVTATTCMQTDRRVLVSKYRNRTIIVSFEYSFSVRRYLECILMGASMHSGAMSTAVLVLTGTPCIQMNRCELVRKLRTFHYYNL